VLAGGVGVGGGGGGGSLAGSSPITQYMAQSSIPPYLNIPNSSSSAAAGLVGHDDTNRVYMNTGEDLNKKYPNMAGKGKWIIPEGGGTVGLTTYSLSTMPTIRELVVLVFLMTT
jgi:hypothetical protein